MRTQIEPIMNTVRCNKCLMSSRLKPQFFFFECGHLICHNCEKLMVKRELCLICKEAARVIKLSGENLHPCMEMLFWPFDNVVKQNTRVMKFKMAQEAASLRHLEKKYAVARDKVVATHLENKALEKEDRRLREELMARGNPGFPVDDFPTNQSISDSSFKSAPPRGFTPGSARKEDPNGLANKLSRMDFMINRNDSIGARGSSVSSSSSTRPVRNGAGIAYLGNDSTFVDSPTGQHFPSRTPCPRRPTWAGEDISRILAYRLPKK